MIGHLLDYAGMLKNQCGYSTLLEIALEYVPSDETAQNNDKEEYEDDAKVDNWSMDRIKKRPGHKRDSGEA